MAGRRSSTYRPWCHVIDVTLRRDIQNELEWGILVREARGKRILQKLVSMVKLAVEKNEDFDNKEKAENKVGKDGDVSAYAFAAATSSGI